MHRIAIQQLFAIAVAFCVPSCSWQSADTAVSVPPSVLEVRYPNADGVKYGIDGAKSEAQINRFVTPIVRESIASGLRTKATATGEIASFTLRIPAVESEPSKIESRNGPYEGELRTTAILSDTHYRVVLRQLDEFDLLCVVTERRIGERDTWDEISSSRIEERERAADNIDIAVKQIAGGIAEHAAAASYFRTAMSETLQVEKSKSP
jgi:hypothetical protein